MFDKKQKALYAVNQHERSLIDHFAASVAMAQFALQKFLNDIGARERIPPGAVFDAKRMAFVMPPAEKKE